MAMFQVLPEMVGPVEFLRRVTLAKLVHVGEMFNAAIPVGLRMVQEFFSAIATRIRRCAGRIDGSRWTECRLVISKGSTRPRMSPQVERVLMTLRLVLVLETVVAEIARVLLLVLVCPDIMLVFVGGYGE